MMTKNTFKAGDAVQRISGGATLTVDYKTKAGLYMCKWYEESGWHSAEFEPEQIRLVDRKTRMKVQ